MLVAMAAMGGPTVKDLLLLVVEVESGVENSTHVVSGQQAQHSAWHTCYLGGRCCSRSASGGAGHRGVDDGHRGNIGGAKGSCMRRRACSIVHLYSLCRLAGIRVSSMMVMMMPASVVVMVVSRTRRALAGSQRGTG